uniref:tyrosine-type recombinase/integrase n=1 Tax=[Ruminococcus] torques TaxID=33039 RepID=UPI00402AA4A2
MESKKEAFREWLIESERSDNTINAYMTAVNQFFSMFSEVSKKNMIEFKRQKLEEHKPKTAANRCIAMNQYCEFIGMPECKVKSIKIHKQNTVENVPTMQEYQHLLGSLKEDEKWKTYWMIQFLAKTGARVSEFVRFERSHLEKGEVTLWTKGKFRKILIPSDLIQESREYFKSIQNSKWMFPNRYGEQMTERGVAQTIKSCNRYGIRKEVLHPHAFRHFYAIQFLKHNKNIALLADLLGHESVDTTAIYLRLSAEEQKAQFNDAMKW